MNPLLMVLLMLTAGFYWVIVAVATALALGRVIEMRNER